MIRSPGDAPRRLGSTQPELMDFDSFAIGFDHRDRERLHALWDEALDDEQWSDGPLTRAFEASWAAWNGLPAVATSSWTGAALAALEFFEVRGRTVLCPSNTFMATPLAIAGRRRRSVQFVDCNRARPLHVVRRLRAQGARAQAARGRSSSTSAATSRSTSSRSPRTAAPRGSSCSRTARTRTARRGTGGAPAPGATRASGRSRPRRRSRPAKAACSSRRHPELIEFARRVPQLRQAGLRAARAQLPAERVHRRARHRRRRAARRDHRVEEHGRARASSIRVHPNRVRPARGDGLRATTSTSSSTRSSARPARCTTSRAIACSATTSTCRTATGSRRTTGACRSTTGRLRAGPAGGVAVRVLVTGGAGFIGSHVVDRLLAHGHEPVIFDLVHVAAPRAGRRRDGDRRPRRPRHRAARRTRLRRGHPSRRRRRRQRRRRRPDPRRPDQRPRHADDPRGGAARGDRAGSSTAARSGSTATHRPRATLDEDDAARAARRTSTRRRRSPARCTAARTTQLYGGRAHDPALRDPVRPARAPRGGRAGVRRCARSAARR